MSGRHARGTKSAKRRTIALVSVLAVGMLALVGERVAAAPSAASPVSIYTSTQKPAETETYDRNPVELGVRFSVTKAGTITALKFYKANINTGTHTGALWTASGQKLASGTYSAESASGWQTLKLPTPVVLTPNTAYIASYHAPVGRYSQSTAEFNKGKTAGNSTIRATTGLYSYSSAMVVPSHTWKASGYGVDVVFLPGGTITKTPTGTGGNSASPTPTPTPSHTTTSSSPPPSLTPTPTHSTTSSSPPPSVTPTPTHSTTSSSPAPSTSSATSTPPVTLPTGYPDASDTGVPAGTVLKNVPGDATSGPGWSYSGGIVTIRTANTVFSGYNVTGTIEVYGVGVVVKDNVITASGNTWAVGLRPSASNVTISDNTIQGPTKVGANRLQYGIFGDLGGDAGSQILRNNIQLVCHPIQLERGLVQDNYAHDIAINTTGANADHVDVFFSGGGTTDPLTLRHNTFINDWKGNGLAGDIMLNNAFGVQSNRTIEDNYLAGGNFTIYAGQVGPPGTNDVIRNNVFSTQVFANSGQYAPVRDLAHNSGNVWSNNVWADGPNAGKPIPT